MKSQAARVGLLFWAITVGCTDPEPLDTFAAPQRLGGQEISPTVLQVGRDAYRLNCRPCHGHRGDGQGPASYGLRPPPRDLRLATYKFAGVVDGLPHDDDLARIIRRGLNGTAMLPWRVGPAEMHPLLQYIKTFSPPDEGWRDPDATLGKRVVPSHDPWQDKAAAVARGKEIYHGYATCWSCHPAYATPADIQAMSQKLVDEGLRTGGPISDFRANLTQPEAKESQTYLAGKTSLRILPPDFLYNDLRTVDGPSNILHASASDRRAEADLFRIIGAGIPGTAMPAWYGSLPDREIWAMAHYVASLLAMRGDKKGYALRDAVASAASSAVDREPNQ